jgi:single-stranded DNA-binding protein
MNSVCLVGRLSRPPVVRFDDENQCTTFTLTLLEPGREWQAFTLYVPCVCWGKAAEAAGVLEGDDLVSVQGKLCWYKPTDKHGQAQGMLAVTVYEVSVLQPAELQA